VALVAKKKAKRKLGSRSASSGSSSRETSPLRPIHQLKRAPCSIGCPNHTKVRTILTTIAQTEDAGRTYEESFEMAYNLFIEKNPIPATIGRVCPHPCESECNRQYKEGSLAINNVERFIGDYAIENSLPIGKLTEDTFDEKIAVIGGGPAGISCAFQLARRGYKNVTIFEAFDKAGGMLRYGIPDYRLPQDLLDKEIQRVLDIGIELKTNTRIGTDIPYAKLQEDYDAIFVSLGAHKGRRLGLANEDSPNVFAGTHFLNLINSGQNVEVGDKVLVVGGGDTAIDAARIAKRLGASEVTIVYRRTRKEMPAIEPEIDGAEEEGIKIHYLVAPMELVVEDGKVVKMICQQMELGEPDSSGRRRPVPIEGETLEIETTCVIPAISQEPDFDDLEHLREGRDWLKVNDRFATPMDKTYAGGDNVNLGLVVDALFHGRIAAETIDCNFRGKEYPPDPNIPVAGKDLIDYEYYKPHERHENVELPAEERVKKLDIEISSTFTRDELIDETKRCFSCGSCFDCGTCWSICQDQAIHKPVRKFEEYTFKLDLCKGCFKCAEACPCGYIEMKNPLNGELAKRDEQRKVVYP